MTADELLRFTDELWLGCSESADYHRAVPEVRDVWLQATTVLGLVRRRAAMTGKPVTAFVGATNVGKSTLLNSILGAELTPRRNGPCTAIPLFFEHHDALEVRISYRGDFRPLVVPCVDAASIHAALQAQGTIVPQHPLERMTARLPHFLLRRMTIVDTPGFGAVQHGRAEGSHEESLVDFLAGGEMRVVWVVQAEQGIGAREMEFFREHLALICDDIVFTHCEDWSKYDSIRYADRFLPAFGRERPRLHFTSAIAGTGIDQFREHLIRCSYPANRMGALVSALEHLGSAVDDWFQVRGDRLVRARLRPDTLLRLSSLPQRDGIRKHVLDRLSGKAFPVLKER